MLNSTLFVGTINTAVPSIMQTHTDKDGSKTVGPVGQTEVFHLHTPSSTYTSPKTFSLVRFHLLVFL
jgi:hypothetical protein